MEALAAGKLIATHIGTAPELSQEGVNELLVNSAEPTCPEVAMGLALADLDPLGHEARETFEGIGSWNHLALDTESVYSDGRAHRQHKLGSRWLRHGRRSFTA